MPTTFTVNPGMAVSATNFHTIQAAIDASMDGDTINVVSGTYAEHVTINKDVTINGPNAGVAGNGVRSAEADITGGIEIAAAGAGATLAGFKVTGSYNSAGTDLPNGIFIEASNVALLNNRIVSTASVVNSQFVGTPVEERPFSTTGGLTGLNVSGNLVSGWAEGAYITSGTAGTISHNVFTGNGNGVLTESILIVIAANAFSNEVGAHIAPLPFADVDLKDVIGADNTFDAVHIPIAIFPNEAGDQVISGTDFAEHFIADYQDGGNDTYLGRGGNDTIEAGDGNDILNGGKGADHLDGGDGIDTASYINATAGVTVSLATGTGIAGEAKGDTLVNIENLIGSNFKDSLTGDSGDNVIDGAQGADTMAGKGGDDTYIVDNAKDIVTEGSGLTSGHDTVVSSVTYTLTLNVEDLFLQAGAGNITGKGNIGANVIVGNEGDNKLNGDLGADTLIGNGGHDSFVFNTKLGGGNIDTLADLTSGEDHVVLDDAIFKGLAVGALDPGAFVAGTAATAARAQVLYDSATGTLSFDADGTGAKAAVQFAHVDIGTIVTANDFTIV